MRLINLPTIWTIVLDVLIWLIVQPLIAYCMTRLPSTSLHPDAWLYRPRSWERDGDIYQTLLRIRRWKGWLPSGGVWFKGFDMRSVDSRDAAYLYRWRVETCRAELAHWLQIAVAPLFMLWNPPVAGIVIMIYALAANLPCLLVQRHNRPRLAHILRRGMASGAPSDAALQPLRNGTDG